MTWAYNNTGPVRDILDHYRQWAHDIDNAEKPYRASKKALDAVGEQIAAIDKENPDHPNIEVIATISETTNPDGSFKSVIASTSVSIV